MTIRRDCWGIPHIAAEDDRDAWFSLGFVVGQDRCFQLEFYRRAVSGTMAAAVGRAALGHDRLVRRIGYRRAAEAHFAVLDAPTADLLSSYAAGVTAGMTLGRRRRPHELALLRLEPEPWTAVDVLAFIKLITASLATNWDTELARLAILQRDGPTALEKSDFGYAEHHPAIDARPSSRAIESMIVDLSSFRRQAPSFGGSNSWAVGGSMTERGGALLANDPHLNPQTPSHWYLAHVRTPAWEAAGASLVGAPGFIAGHNGAVAWGVTSARADLSDLVIEHVGADGRSVLRGGGFVGCDVVDEVIDVRGGRAVTERVLVTDSGPVISPVLDDETAVFSLRATWLGSDPLRGFFDAGRCTSVAELFECFRQWNGPSVNLTAVDVRGDIGWKYVGTIPGRRDDPSGLPLDGAGSGGAWTDGSVPFDDLPSVLNSSRQFVVTANNLPVDGPEGVRLGREWADGFRAKRIAEVLSRRVDWTVEGALDLQLDRQCVPWGEIREVIIDRDPAEPSARVAVRVLAGWDGDLSRTSGVSVLYQRFLFGVRREVARLIAPRSWELVVGRGVHDLSPFNGLAVRGTSWVTRLLIEQPEDWITEPWDAFIERCLGDAVDELRGRLHRPVRSWSFGRRRRLRFQHLLHAIPLVGPLLDLGPLDIGGDLNTVAMCAPNPLDPSAAPVATATMRFAVEAGDWQGARFVLAGGQSGDPTSPHYDDQLPLWVTGGGVAIAWNDEDVEDSTRHRLELTAVTA